MNQHLNTLLGGGEPSRGSPSGWSSRLASLLPFGLLAGFLLVLLAVLGDRLLPAREVRLESVVTLAANPGDTPAQATPADPANAPMLFQASGWIEPDPLPIKATALIDGVIGEVHVLEGETVKKGQRLATFIDEDFRLDLRTAESRLASLQSQADAHEGRIATAKAQIETLRKEVEVARARHDVVADQVERYKSIPAGNVPEREVAQARLELKTRKADTEALAAKEKELQGRLAELEAASNDYEAQILEAKTEIERRRLALERTRIHSPVDGVILRLLAMPGQKRMLAMDGADSATIAILYQPDHLQARVDVPLAEAAKLAVGQPVRIRSNFLPDQTFHGRVTRIVGEADLQRNTLQAKVRIDSPDARLRPEMLCRAEFLAPNTKGQPSKGNSPGRVQVFVPESALTAVDGDSAQVWTLDSSGERAAQKKVKLGEERRDGHRVVASGLQPGDRVVVAPPGDLEPGQRIRNES